MTEKLSTLRQQQTAEQNEMTAAHKVENGRLLDAHKKAKSDLQSRQAVVIFKISNYE